ncbi:Mbov_0395 family pilin-like conjugal transfer protein [Brotaphodocola sp.]|uniref:Mbov_0395 family pilin-like conjugal transfer protein n=1 Tax=Brotaphodocola sp. TaxID=3073577 RepID=UPI003D7D31B8
MNMNLILLTASTTAAASSPFGAVADPIIKLIDSAVTPAILLVAALGAIYCVMLGAKLAKAEEPQDQQKAKQALKNAIIGFVLIFVLLVALKIGVSQMTTWYTNSIPTAK